MKGSIRYANTLTPVPTGAFGARLRRLFRPLPRPRQTPPAAQVAALLETIEGEPALRMWVMTLAGRAPGVQRALLARATRIFRAAGHSASHALSALAQMADPTLREAVLPLLRE